MCPCAMSRTRSANLSSQVGLASLAAKQRAAEVPRPVLLWVALHECLAWQGTTYPAALRLSMAFFAAGCCARSLQQTPPLLIGTATEQVSMWLTVGAARRAQLLRRRERGCLRGGRRAASRPGAARVPGPTRGAQQAPSVIFLLWAMVIEDCRHPNLPTS